MFGHFTTLCMKGLNIGYVLVQILLAAVSEIFVMGKTPDNGPPWKQPLS